MTDTSATSYDSRPGSNFPEVDSPQNWNTKYQQARMSRMTFERKWYTYLAFVQGKQYVTWSYEAAPLATGRMLEPTNPNNRVRLVINKTRRILRKEHAKINKEQVRGFVQPNNTDDNSQAAARAAEQLASYLTEELKLQSVFKRADWWMLICGTSFLKCYYDPNMPMGFTSAAPPQQFMGMGLGGASPNGGGGPSMGNLNGGPPMPPTGNGQPQMPGLGGPPQIPGMQQPMSPPMGGGMPPTYGGMQGPQAGPMQQSTQMQQLMGGPCVEVVDPFHILVPNLDEQDIQKQEWVMHVTMKSPDWVEDRFGIKIDGQSTATNTLESRLLAVQGMTQDYDMAKAVEVREVWIRPNVTSKYPQGALIYLTQDKILEAGPHPYMHGKYPFAKRTYIENSIFYGTTLVEDLMPLQVEYNRTRSQIVEDKNRMGRPQLAVERGSMDVKKLRGAAGDVVEYAPGSRAPQAIEIAGLPNYIIDHTTRISNEMAELASQESGDKNAIPTGITAATAIAYIHEDQDALVQDTIRDKEIAWEEVTQWMLSNIGQFWDGQRMVTVAGKNGTFESLLFSKSDLQGQTNWRAIVGSATPQSYAAKQAQIMELMKMGAISVPDGLEYMDMGDTARLYEGMQTDKREAQKENIRMGNGVQAAVEKWQEHLIHIHAHDDIRKREEYESWSQQSKALIAYHNLMHMQMFLQEVGFTAPMGPDGMLDQNFLQLQNQQMQMTQQAMQSGQTPQVESSYEMALRREITKLTMAPPPPGAGPAGGPPGALPPQHTPNTGAPQ
jgi:hypothetical protein